MAIDPKFYDPEDAEPKPEPEKEPADSHTPPLDDIDDVKWLAEDDPRRVEIEKWRRDGS